MFKKLSKAEAARVDSVLFNAVMATSRADDIETSDFVLEALDDLRDNYGQVDPKTLGFRLKDV